MSQLCSLSNLGVVLYPTTPVSSAQAPLLLFSSVIDSEIWHLTLIGSANSDHQVQGQEIWWEGEWSLQQLKQLAKSQSSDALIRNIRVSFSEDDIALKGYRSGDEAELRLTMRYSEPENAFTVTLGRLNLEKRDLPAVFQRKPMLSLLDIACKAYSEINRTRRETLRQNPASGAPMASSTRAQNPARHANIAIPGPSNASQPSQAPPKIHSTRNLANPSKKSREQVVDGFLSTDSSD